MTDVREFAKWLMKRQEEGCGYLMGAVGQKTKDISEGSWLVQQYRGSKKQFAKAKEWLRTAKRVFDCQGLADFYVTKKTGTKVNVYARNNYDKWCSVKGKGRIPEKYRVPGAAVFMYSQEAGRITHVGFLVEAVDGKKPNGDWYVVEARGVMHGVVKTRLFSRGWNRWGLMDKYFDYSKVMAGDEAEFALGDRTLKMGRSGGDVRTLQEILMKLGFEPENNGIFGEKTAEAVKAFKVSQGLTADGVYGEKAHEALMREIDDAGGDCSGKKVRIEAAGTWNVRKGPGAGYGIVTVVRQGMEFVHRATDASGWMEIEINGGTGWVSPKCGKVI